MSLGFNIAPLYSRGILPGLEIPMLPSFRTVCHGVVLIALLASGGVAAGQARQGRASQAAHAFRVSQPPVIDGDLNDPAWNQGQWLGGALTNTKTGQATRQRTRFQIGFDQQRLYLAVIADTDRAQRLAQHDPGLPDDSGELWELENVELFLDASSKDGTYRHFIFSAWGDVYDAIRTQGGQQYNRQWDADIKAEVGRREGAWTLEVAIPFYELGVPVEPDTTWRFNLARHGQAFGSFAPMDGTYHQPKQFARLVFPEDTDLGEYAWRIRRPRNLRVVKTDHGLALRGGTLVTNHTGEFRFVQVHARLKRTGGERIKGAEATVRGGLDAGQSQRFRLRVPVVEPGEQRELVLRLQSRPPQSQTLAKARAPVETTYQPLEVVLLQPAYHDRVYARQDLNQWRARAVLSPPESQLQGLQLQAAVHRKGEDQPLATASRPLSGRRTTIGVKTGSDLKPGRYRLVLNVSRDKKQLYQASRPVRVMPKVANAWWLNRRGVLYHNGRRMFPLGFFLMHLDWTTPGELHRLGVNAHGDYGSRLHNDQQTIARLKRYASAGVYVMAYPYPPQYKKMGKQPRPLSQAEEKALRERIRVLRDQPGLMAWYLADEPDRDEMVYQRLKRINEIVHEEDPYHPTVILLNAPSEVPYLKDSADILMPDPYPFFKRGGRTQWRDLDIVTRFTRKARKAMGPGESVWITPQVYARYTRGKKSDRAPRFIELRNMYYQAVVEGAKGLIAFAWRDASMVPRLRIGSRAICPSLRALDDFILAPEAKVAEPVESPPALHVSSRVVNGGVVIFAVNTSYDKALDVSFKLTGPAAGKTSYRVLREDRAVKVKQGRLTDRFAPLATHVYIAADVPRPGRTLAQIKARIAQANRPDDPDNLAHRATGTRVEGSPARDWYAAATILNDGVLGNWSYKIGSEVKDPHVTLHFGEPVDVGRIVVRGGGLKHFEGTVKAPAGEGWREIDFRQRRPTGGRVLMKLNKPVHVSSLRLDLPHGKQLFLKEIKVYAP